MSQEVKSLQDLAQEVEDLVKSVATLEKRFEDHTHHYFEDNPHDAYDKWENDTSGPVTS
jgi:hypothetical protein